MEPKPRVNCVNKQQAKPASKFVGLLSTGLLVLSLSLSGCSSTVTFPGDKLAESIEEICKNLYNMDAIARVSGGTIGVMLYVDNILDETGTAMEKEIQETLGNLSLSITRVALSTDREVNFTIIAIRGIEEQFEIRVIRYVTDVKKAQTEALSITESINRTVYIQSRYEPVAEGEDLFDMEEIKYEFFLAQQIIQRARQYRTKETEDAQEPQVVNELFDGRYFETAQGNSFEFTIVSFDKTEPGERLLKFLRVTKDVILGYGFEHYKHVTIRDLMGRQKLVVGKSTLELYSENKISEDQILQSNMSQDLKYSAAFANALEMMGFTAQ